MNHIFQIGVRLPGEEPGRQPLHAPGNFLANCSAERLFPLEKISNLPFQIGVAERGFAKPFVKIFKVGSHPLVDDYPINWKLLLFIQS